MANTANTADRRLEWDGLANARDLGGLALIDGCQTRIGAVVRADGLDHLSPAGWDALHRHGIRTIVDLRSGFEVDAAPYVPPIDGIEVVRPGWEEGLLDDPEFADWAATGRLSCALYYQRFLERWPERTTATVRAVAQADAGGVVIHCVHGRDRTGLLSLLLLSLAGAEHAAIVGDYLASDDHLARDERRGDLHRRNQEVAVQLFAAAGTTAADEISGLLHELDVASYLLAAGLSDDDLTRVRRRLVT